MATPKRDLPPPPPMAAFVNEWQRLTPEAQATLRAWWDRINDHERRIAALEP